MTSRPTPVKIWPAAQPDLPGILALVGGAGLPLAGVADCLATALVARRLGAVVGVVALEIYGDVALLRSLAVVPELRGRGIGRDLTAAILRLARDFSVGRVFLLTETAADFFYRIGFRRLERRDVAPQIQVSAEFRQLCPRSAQAMIWESPPSR